MNSKNRKGLIAYSRPDRLQSDLESYFKDEDYFESSGLGNRKNWRRSQINNDRKYRIISMLEQLAGLNIPGDIKPSQETIQRAINFCDKAYSDSRLIAFKDPVVGAADDNSIDLFWGDKKRRLLVNIPAADAAIMINLIDERGGTESYLTDGHYFNLLSVLKELRDSFD